jgi:hypothetical protein
VSERTVATTANPQVALYTINPVAAGNVSVQFGTTTGYGLTTVDATIDWRGAKFVCGRNDSQHALSYEWPLCNSAMDRNS